MTQIETRTSTEVVTLETKTNNEPNPVQTADGQEWSGVHSQGHLRQLLLGQVQRVVEGHDAVVVGVRPWRQVGSQDGVVHHVHEGRDAVPALVVEPDLRGPGNNSIRTAQVPTRQSL